MANTHRYGFRYIRELWGGGDVPQIVVRPIASGYQPNNGSVSVNLNVGDPVAQLETGAVALTAPGGSDGINTDGTETTFGIVVGFPRVLISGNVRPNGFYPGGTVYGSGLAPYNLQTLCAVIPVAGREWAIDTAAAGGSSFDTYEEFQALVGAGCADIVYSALNTTSANPKANPMFDIANVTKAVANTRQLRCVGLGPIDDLQDFTLTNVQLRVVFNVSAEAPFRTTAGLDNA